MTTPINFELAKLLKEKGFNEQCTYIHIKGEKHPIYIELFKEGYGISACTNDQINEYSYEYGFKGYLKNKEILAIPTIAEVVMWLYKKHGIWIEVNHIKTFDINRFHITIWNYKNTSDYITIYHDGIGPGYKVWDTPTEAYEAAIEYTLKNLI